MSFDLPVSPHMNEDKNVLREVVELVADFNDGDDPISLQNFTEFNIQPKNLDGEENQIRYGNVLVDTMMLEDLPYGATITFKTHTLGNVFRSKLEGSTLVSDGTPGESGYTETVSYPVNSSVVDRPLFDLYVKQMIRGNLSDTGLGYRIWKISNCRGTLIEQSLLKDNFTELTVSIDSVSVGGVSAISYCDRIFSSLQEPVVS